MVLSKIVVLKSAWRRAVDFSLNIGYENYEDKINDFFSSMWLGQQVIESLKTNKGVKICRGALKFIPFWNVYGWHVK